jgi:hypothetical protein
MLGTKADEATVSEGKKAHADGNKHHEIKGRQTCGYLQGRHTLPASWDQKHSASLVKSGHQREAERK